MIEYLSPDKLFYKISEKLSSKFFLRKNTDLSSDRIQDPDIIGNKIYQLINGNDPIMIARYGATELACLLNYLGVKSGRPNYLTYIQGHALDWWWHLSLIKQIETWSGFFPSTQQNVELFCTQMLEDTKELDMLASWLDGEVFLKDKLLGVELFQGLFLDPFWSKVPWSSALAGKKVLVIHPFEETIKHQYARRQFLFDNKDILPQFELRTLKAVQSLGGASKFNSWFDALHYMESEIDKIDFDICLIGAGAYGFPLAAYVKRKGKKAIHMGGSLQLLFGIKGKRWENPDYGMRELGTTGKYPSLINDYWVRPDSQERPQTASSVENACYW